MTSETENEEIVAPSYATLQGLMTQQLAAMEASEAHGFLVATLVAGSTDPESWLEQSLGNREAVENLAQDQADALVALYGSTLSGLNAEEMSFDLFLPGDEDSIMDRADALANWCSGFLYGAGVMGISESNALSEESQEWIKDLTVLSRAIAEEGDEDEAAFFEIVEYLRMGALLINEDLRTLRESKPSSDKIH